MSDLFTHLAELALGQAAVIRPLVASRFGFAPVVGADPSMPLAEAGEAPASPLAAASGTPIGEPAQPFSTPDTARAAAPLPVSRNMAQAVTLEVVPSLDTVDPDSVDSQAERRVVHPLSLAGRQTSEVLKASEVSQEVPPQAQIVMAPDRPRDAAAPVNTQIQRTLDRSSRVTSPERLTETALPQSLVHSEVVKPTASTELNDMQQLPISPQVHSTINNQFDRLAADTSVKADSLVSLDRSTPPTVQRVESAPLTTPRLTEHVPSTALPINQELSMTLEAAALHVAPLAAPANDQATPAEFHTDETSSVAAPPPITANVELNDASLVRSNVSIATRSLRESADMDIEQQPMSPQLVAKAKLTPRPTTLQPGSQHTDQIIVPISEHAPISEVSPPIVLGSHTAAASSKVTVVTTATPIVSNASRNEAQPLTSFVSADVSRQHHIDNRPFEWILASSAQAAHQSIGHDSDQFDGPVPTREPASIQLHADDRNPVAPDQVAPQLNEQVIAQTMVRVSGTVQRGIDDGTAETLMALPLVGMPVSSDRTGTPYPLTQNNTKTTEIEGSIKPRPDLWSAFTNMARHGTALPEPPQVEAEALPTIRVTIGRIEVRSTPTAQPTIQRTRPVQPKLSLHDYLKQDRSKKA